MTAAAIWSILETAVMISVERWAARYHAVYRPHKVGGAVGKPARLVFSGRRKVLVEIPFALKGVPLP